MASRRRGLQAAMALSQHCRALSLRGHRACATLPGTRKSAVPDRRMPMSLPLQPVLAHLEAGLDASIERWKDLLRIPSIGTDPAHRDATRRAAAWLVKQLQALGFEAAARGTPGQPIVIGHHPGPDGAGGPRVLYYGHYDVQPPDPLHLWDSPPFEPTIVEAAHGPRMVARGAVDDKGQLMTWLEALHAWHGVHGTLPLPVSVLIEGEEESGSPSLEPFLETHRGELRADVCVVSDTNMWNIETPALATLLRGLLYTEIALSGPAHDLHSGLYGGGVPNPLNVLARMLGQLHDVEGRVQVPGFYEDVEELGDDERRRLAGLPFDEAAFLGGAGLTAPTGEAGRSTLERIWTRPTCDINGIWGGYTGPGSKTVIPAQASAKVSFRLVPRQNPGKILAGLRAFLATRTPPDCRFDLTVHATAPALRIPTQSPYVQAARRALEQVFPRPPVLIGMGGSIPAVEAIKRLLGIDALLLGFGLADDRVHSPNEKFEVRCFTNGIRTHATLLAELATLA
jgi:acetylornithine deacetylase/succinyl-diaminopimelate desuccinylase-like protein